MLFGRQVNDRGDYVVADPMVHLLAIGVDAFWTHRKHKRLRADVPRYEQGLKLPPLQGTSQQVETARNLRIQLLGLFENGLYNSYSWMAEDNLAEIQDVYNEFIREQTSATWFLSLNQAQPVPHSLERMPETHVTQFELAIQRSGYVP